MAAKQGGRKAGGKNQGFFFRSGRGWVATDGNSYPLLRDPEGNTLKDPKLSKRIVREAYARFLVKKDQKQNRQRLAVRKAADSKKSVTLLAVCQAYLSHAKSTGKAKTHHDRADTLFDFCFGLPPEFRNKKET